MEKTKSIIKNPIVGLMALTTFLAFFRIASQSYTVDEAFSLYATKDWHAMRNILWNEEANMWLYYTILHFWRILGTSEFVVRSLSALFSIFSVFAIYTFVSRLFDRKIAFLSSLLVSLNMFFIYYAQEARSYSLLLLLTTLSSYYYLNRENTQAKALYVIASTLSIYAHFFGALIIAAQFAVSVLKGEWKQHSVLLAIVLVLALPLVLSPSFQSHQVDWIARPDMMSLVLTGFLLAGDLRVLYVVYPILYILLAKHLLTNLHDKKYLMLISLLGVPVLSVFVFSLIVKPIYTPDYFIICLPAFVTLAAVSISKFKTRALQTAFVSILVMSSLVRLSLWYTEDVSAKRIITNRQTDWRSAAKYIETNSDRDDAVIFYGYYGRNPYSIYSTSGPQTVEIATSKYSLGGGDVSPRPNTELITHLNYARVWLVLSTDSLEVFNGEEQYSIITSALEQNYHVQQAVEFAGVKDTLYERDDI